MHLGLVRIVTCDVIIDCYALVCQFMKLLFQNEVVPKRNVQFGASILNEEHSVPLRKTSKTMNDATSLCMALKETPEVILWYVYLHTNSSSEQRPGALTGFSQGGRNFFHV